MASNARTPSLAVAVVGVLLALYGSYFVVGGGWLLALGGTAFYLLSGAGTLVAGLLIARGRRRGLQLYTLVWLATLVWAVAEAGLDGWRLFPRVFAPTVLLALLWTPWLTRRLTGGRRVAAAAASPAHSGRSAAVLTIVAVLVVGAGLLLATGAFDAASQTAGTAASGTAAPAVAGNGPAAAPRPSASPTDWRHYGNDLAGRRYSPTSQLTPDNVSRLEVAWTAHSGDSADAAERHGEREFHSEATPLKVGDTLYTCTPHSTVLALDAIRGTVKWRWQTTAQRDGNPYLVCRGVSYFDAGADAAAAAGDGCRRRVYAPTFDAKIVALDADSGQPCRGFGQAGFIDLRQNAGPSPPGWQISTTPPVVASGRLVVGSRIIDNEAVDEPSGVVRAYDLLDGHLIWAWDMGRGQDAITSLPPGEVYTRGTPNAWGAITADEALGMVYLPLGNPTPDYYGGQRRPFDDRFNTSIVALDTATGKFRWSFQTVHHDIWDLDLPVGPSLVDLPDPGGAGGRVPALVQTTKTGQVFLLNRQTGEPIATVEEKPVPQHGAAPGERLSPTQPFSTGMPSFTPAPLRPRDVWGATPIDQLACRIQYQRSRREGIYTPPGLTPMIGHPAFDGITDWGGAAVDPERGLMTINLMAMPFSVRLVDRQSEEGRRLDARKTSGGESARALQVYKQTGTPYLATVQAWLGPFGAPCVAPPWGELAAVDLRTRRLLWRRPLGTSRDSGLFGSQVNLPLPTGVPNLGGTVITRGGLVFVAATTDQYLRAFDLKSGRELWRGRLPAGGQATPVVYVASDGREYVVVTAGGHGALGTRYGDATVAFALPAASG